MTGWSGFPLAYAADAVGLRSPAAQRASDGDDDDLASWSLQAVDERFLTDDQRRKRRRDAHQPPCQDRKRFRSSYAATEEELADTKVARFLDPSTAAANDAINKELAPTPLGRKEALEIAERYGNERRDRAMAAPPPPPAAPKTAPRLEDVYAEMEAAFAKMTVDAREACQVRSRTDLSGDLLRDQRRCVGDQRMDAIRRTLNSLGYTRSKYQKASFKTR